MDTNTLIALGIGAILVAVILVALRYRSGIRVWGEGHGIKGGIEGSNHADSVPQQHIEDVRAERGDATVRSSTGLGTTVKHVRGGQDATVDLSDAPVHPKAPPPDRGGQ